MKNQKKVDPKMLDTMLSVFNNSETAKRKFSKRFALGVIEDDCIGAAEKDLTIYEDEEYISCFNGRIDNFLEQHERKDIYSYLSKHLYKSTENLRGDFAIVTYNLKEDKLILIRDHLGTRPLYYLDLPLFFVFATEMKVLKVVHEANIEIDEQWIADTISHVTSEKWRTPYEHIRRLTPGNMLIFKNKLEMESYWDLNIINSYCSKIPLDF